MQLGHAKLPCLFLVAVLLGASGCEPPKTIEDGAEARVRRTFAAYKAALLAKDGQAAVTMVSEETLAYFEARRRDALTLSAAETRGTRLMDKTMILILRARLGNELADMSRERLFSHAVDQGWVGSEVATIEVAKVQVTSDGMQAATGLRSGTQVVPVGQGFVFFLRDGTWKIDVMSVVNADTDRSFEAQLKTIDPDLDTALLKLVSTLTGTPQTVALFEPLAPGAR